MHHTSRAHHSTAAAAVSVATSLLAVLTGLWIGGLAAGPAPTVPQASASSSVVAPVGSTRIVVRLGDEVATATLADTSAARQFAAMLPLQLELGSPMGQALSAPLPRWIDVTSEDHVLDPSAGEIYYWPANGELAIFYDDLGQTVPPPGLVRLGAIDSGPDAIEAAGNRLTVRIDPAPASIS